MFGHVFKCNSNITAKAKWEERLLAYDPVIFDFGLMNRVLKMSKCVANYLDGGYLRFSWSVHCFFVTKWLWCFVGALNTHLLYSSS
jgi:hypothetical protein